MELFAIMLSVPAAFALTAVYGKIILKYKGLSASARRFLYSSSHVLLVCFTDSHSMNLFASREFKISLRILLAFNLLLALWLARVVNHAHAVRDAVGVIERLGASVTFEKRERETPAFLRRLLPYIGSCYFTDVIGIDAAASGISDQDVARLAMLSRLRTLVLYGTPVSDAGLRAIGGLAELEHLDLAR